MSRIYTLLGVDHPFDPTSRFTTSWLLPPLVLALIRALFSLYAFVTIFTIFGWNDSHNDAYQTRRFFSYFTDLTYCGLAFYFLFSALHTFSYARTGKAWLQTWPRPLQAAHWIYYTTVVTFPILVTLVFWIVLYNGTWYTVEEQGWSNISLHALNSLFALFEIVIPRTNPPPPLHILILVILLALYLALAYITHATQGWYPYSFLDHKHGGGHLAAYIMGILGAACVIFGVVWAITSARNKLTKKLGFEGKFAQRRAKAIGSMEESGSNMVELREETK